MTTRIYGAATAVPDHVLTREQSERFMRRVLQHRTDGVDREEAMMYFEALHANSGVDRRRTVIEDFTRNEPDDFSFFPGNWRLDPFPSTRRRMQVYENESIELAEKAARNSLEDADVDPGEITHLVYVTCTGLFAPGPDLRMLDRLGLDSDTRRTVVGFMGCHGAFNGLRTADQIVGDDPDAVVLTICVELCSLHYQIDPDPETIVGNCLFGDGAAATVLADKSRADDGLCDIDSMYSQVAADSLDQMQWHIGDTGFSMTLDVEVPKTLEQHGKAFAQSLLEGTDVGRADIDGWLLHPGGPRIIDAARDAVGLEEPDVEISRSILRDFGNMSAPSILFVLQRHLRRHPTTGPMAMIGFGPGLTMEGAVLTPPSTR